MTSTGSIRRRIDTPVILGSAVKRVLHAQASAAAGIAALEDPNSTYNEVRKSIGVEVGSIWDDPFPKSWERDMPKESKKLSYLEAGWSGDAQNALNRRSSIGQVYGRISC